MLGQYDEMGNKEPTIYYLSKKFVDYESCYSNLEKTYQVEIVSLYVVLYYIVVFPNKSSKVFIWKNRVIQKARVVASTIDWIWHHLCYAEIVKGQEIINPLVENPFVGYQPMTDLLLVESNLNTKTEEEYPNWHLNFDGAVSVHRIESEPSWFPQQVRFASSQKLEFPCINNITEYDVSPASKLL